MNHLTRHDYANALRLLARLEVESGDPQRLIRASVDALGDFVACQVSTVSVCDPVGGGQCTALRADDHAVAVPLSMDERTRVSIVLSRRGLSFSERDRERLELLRPHLAFLYRQACRGPAGSIRVSAAQPFAPDQPDPVPASLTRREGEVMHWLSCGKTDAEIAALLAISPRTVHKHLEHIYVKLGVETRTAAVMRARGSVPAAARISE
jgi:DNA-binding CsgD family transcriptional regulator